MKVLLYCDVLDKSVSDDTLKAIECRIKVLTAANISYTLNPDDDYDIMEIDPAYFLNPFPISEARKKGAAIVVNAHYLRKDRAGAFSFSMQGDKMITPVISALLQKNDTVVVPSEYSAQLLKDAGIKNNIVSIPSAVVTAPSNIQRYVKAFRQFFNVDETPVAVGIGPMTKENGFDDFISIAKRLPRYRFIWMGGVSASEIIPSVSAAYKKEIPSNMRCIQLVTKEVLLGGLASANAVLFMSAESSVSIDVMQAMAMGGLCIIREQALYNEFAQDRKNCIVASDPDDFYSKAEHYIKTDCPDIRVAAKETAAGYTNEVIGKKYKALYTEVMSDLALNRIEAYAKANEKPDALNIGLFCETYPPDVNGVAVSVRTLHKQLLAMGHNVYVITPASDTKLFGTEFSGGILRLPALKLKKLYGYRLGAPRTLNDMNLIKKMNLDVIHNNGEVSMRLLAEAAAKKFNIPMVYTYHTMIEDYTHYVDRGHFEETSKRIVNWYTRRMSEHYNRIIAPTEKTQKALLRFGVKKPIDIIPTGIDTDRFRPENIDSDKLASIKHQLGIEGVFTLCYVGRLAPEKNVSFILENLKRAYEAAGGFKFVITGYGPSEDTLKEQVKELGLEDIVIFAGKQKPEEIQYYFALGDVFVTASSSETQGLTYIEAMGAGVPVIARFDECLSNVLINGVTGFEFNDADSFVKNVAEFKVLSVEKRKELRDNVLAKADEYSLNNFGSNIIRSYTAAIRDKRAGNKIYDK